MFSSVCHSACSAVVVLRHATAAASAMTAAVAENALQDCSADGAKSAERSRGAVV
jgi:hypothetical protein